MGIKIILPVLLLFLINPLLTIIGLAVYGVSLGNKSIGKANKDYLLAFGVLCGIYISLVNMVKEPESDLGVYIYWYKLSKHYNLWRYLLIAPGTMSYKDPLFHAMAWILYKLYVGNVSIYLFTLSLLEYIPCILAIYYFGKRLEMKAYVVVTGILLLCFIPYIHLHTMNIIRQTLANGILCYVMVRHFFYGKKEWLGMAAMVLIHSTSALFLPVLFLPAFGKSFKKAWPWIFGVVVFLVGIQTFAGGLLMAGNFNNESTIGTALTTASGNAAGDYGLTTPLLALVIVFLIYSVFLYFGMILPSTEGLKRFTFVYIYVALFIIIYLKEGLWASRFFHYWFTIVPFILMTAFQKWKIHNNLMLIMSLAMIVFWSIYLQTGAWSYNIPLGPWLTPVPVYFLTIT